MCNPSTPKIIRTQLLQTKLDKLVPQTTETSNFVPSPMSVTPEVKGCSKLILIEKFRTATEKLICWNVTDLAKWTEQQETHHLAIWLWNMKRFKSVTLSARGLKTQNHLALQIRTTPTAT